MKRCGGSGGGGGGLELVEGPLPATQKILISLRKIQMVQILFVSTIKWS